MRFVFDGPLGGTGGVLNAAGTAVISYVMGVGDGVPLDNGPVNVGGMDDGLIHMNHCSVIGKGAAAPLAAGKADASIAEAIVDAAVVADMAAPIAAMEAVVAV
jgi:hypothetical protein